ncbi:MAG: sulfate adenylyltransferase, partial [Acidobacteria bacterium]|nr:sulfate adenylyltransferase [Acidobacteriota bacterium]
MTEELISPYGGKLINLIANENERMALFDHASTLPSVQLTRRQTCDLEMLATGAFSPLRTFMGKADFERVADEMRLADGTIFPIPITLSVETLADIEIGRSIALRDAKNELLAIMDVEEIYEWDRERTAANVFSTVDTRHPLVSEMARWGRFNLTGRLRVLGLPVHYDFNELRMTPAEVREKLDALGHANVVAFQTRNPIHRAHELMTQRALEMIDGTLLLHPVVGMTKEGDIDHYTRVRTYKAVAEQAYPAGRVVLSLLPLAMRMAGPREAIFHAIIRRNFGANHLIVGRDHASPGIDSRGQPFYHPLAAQELAKKHSAEIGMNIIAFEEFAYLPNEDRYEEVGKIAAGSKTLSLSGTQIRENYLG